MAAHKLLSASIQLLPLREWDLTHTSRLTMTMLLKRERVGEIGEGKDGRYFFCCQVNDSHRQHDCLLLH